MADVHSGGDRLRLGPESRRAAITEHELNEAIREKGLDRLDQVKSAYLERGGQISVVPRK